MAKILLLESATTTCSVAISENDKVLACKEVSGAYTHAENLMVFVSDILKESNITMQELNAVAVSKGPGSYTGLRIGVSSAKGICYGLNIPLIAVDTLTSMYAGFRKQLPVLAKYYCPMLDARRMEVYTAILDEQGNIVEPVSAKILTESSFDNYFEKGTVCFFGDGAEKAKSLYDVKANAIFANNFALSAINMVKEANYKYEIGAFEDLAYFEPFYLKDFVSTASLT